MCTVNEEPTNVARYLIWLEQEVLVLVSKTQTGIRSDFQFQNRNQNFKEPDPKPGSQFSLGLEPEPRLLEKKMIITLFFPWSKFSPLGYKLKRGCKSYKGFLFCNDIKSPYSNEKKAEFTRFRP